MWEEENKAHLPHADICLGLDRMEELGQGES
jgi:hypothetical protein